LKKPEPVVEKEDDSEKVILGIVSMIKESFGEKESFSWNDVVEIVDDDYHSIVKEVLDDGVERGALRKIADNVWSFGIEKENEHIDEQPVEETVEESDDMEDDGW
jgi:hypothetical protein